MKRRVRTRRRSAIRIARRSLHPPLFQGSFSRRRPGVETWTPTPVADVREPRIFKAPTAKRLLASRTPSFMQTINEKGIYNAQVCARRRIRKEVIHAIGMAGNRSRKPRRVTPDSSVRC